MRTELEASLGADLRAVRIHTGQAANAAANQFAADAFASGRDVYFRAGQYAPQTTDGRELLAHELIHVLQQTGRQDNQGRLAATAASGTADVQCDQPATPPAAPTAEEQQAFERLAHRFRSRSTNPDVPSTIDDVRSFLDGGRLAENQPTFAQAFVDAVRARTFHSRSGEARGLVLDALKLMGFFEDAVRLIEADTRGEIRVGIALPSFFTHLGTAPRGPGWIGDVLHLREFSAFWPGAIVQNYREFFLRPHSPPPGENTTLRDRVAEEMRRRNEINSASELVPQDRIGLGWVLLREIDLARVNECRDAQAEGAATTARVTATELRLRLLHTLKEREQAIIDDDQQAAFRRLLAEHLVRLADELAPTLEGTLAAYLDWQAGFARFSDAELLGAPSSRFPHASLTESFLASLRRVLVAQSTALLALEIAEDGQPQFPEPAAYSTRLRTWRESLDQALPASGGRAAAPAVLRQLDTALARGAQARRPNAATLRALGLLSLILDRLVQLTLNYDQAADEATPSFADERAGHRIQMARAVAWLARWMQWPDLLDACRATLSADGSGRVQLWLAGEWEPEDAQPIDRLREDFRQNLNRPIIRDTPLTVRHLVDWFHLDYDTRLRATLLELLQPEDRATAATAIPLERINALRQSRSEVRAAMAPNAEAEQAAAATGLPPQAFDLRIPQRFVVRNWEVAIPPGQSVEWDRVLEAHPKTRLSLDRHRSDGDYNILIFPTVPAQGVFAWMTPSIRPLIKLLRTLPILNGVAAAEGLSDADWLARLAPEQLSEAQWAQVDERIHAKLENRDERVRQDLPELWRRLNILRRRVLVMRLRPRLQAYVANPSVAFGPIGETNAQQAARLSTPGDTLQALYDYERNVVPREAAPVQMALLMIGLADVLDGMVSANRPEAEFGRGIYPYLVAALGWLDGDEAKLRELRQGTNTQDEAGNIVYIDRNLRSAKDHLQSLKTAIDETYRAAQDTIGFGSEDGLTLVPLGFATAIYRSHRAGDEHEWTVGSRVGADGRIDTTTGTHYRLLKVYRTFTYHPGVGSGSAEDASNPGLPPRYIDENGVEYPRVNDAGVAEPIPHQPLFRIEIEGNPREVHADDTALLSSLNEIFLWRSFQIQMENLAAGSEAYMQWVMTVVGIVFPEATAAELATTVTQFIVSGELEELVRQLRDDPGEVLNRLVERLRTELFTAENVWRFVLLGGQHNPFAALEGLLPTRARTRVSVPPSGRLARIVNRLRLIGRQFSQALHRVRLYADGPIRSVQGNIAMRPTLGWILRRASHLLEAAADLIPPEVLDAVAAGELPGTPTELVDAARDGISNAGQDLEANVVRLLEAIHHFELPYELLDLDAATELIVGFVVDRFGPRARAARLVLDIIPIPQEHEGRFTGLRTLYQWICAEIAAVWRNSPLDPNTYWRDEMLPLIGTRFRETRDDLVDGLYQATDRFLNEIGQPSLPRPAALPETEIEAVVPEAEAHPAAAPRFTNQPWRLPTSGGASLPPPIRRPLERGFGQQFGHVRLHRGAEGRSATEPVGADALTSGSHVFIHPAQRLDGGAGRRLLAHELTHVIHQTGSHPPGTPAPTSRPGRPASGLRIDTSREAEAERAATRFASGQTVPAPTAGLPSGNPQPSLSERMVNSVIDTITVARSSADFTETPQGGSASHVPGIEVALQLWARTVELIGAATFAAFLRTPSGLSAIPGVSNPDVQEIIRQQLRDRHKELIGEKVPEIAQLAQRPRTNRQPNDPETELNPARFINLLEDFIAAERGIGLQIAFSATDNSISGIGVINVLLQNVGGTSGLWRIAMHASFSGHAADVPDLARAQGEIRQRLRALGPSPAVFSPTSFQFSELFVHDYLELVRSRGRTVDDIPNVHDYTQPTNNRADSLAVATHGNLTSRGIGPFGRESHHTTQYLLVEFFGNLEDASRKAFPTYHPHYPSGVEFRSGTGGEVRGIRSGGRFLDLAALNPDSGRGNNMPAVLLAARTHQRGELHVLREARWDAGTDYATERRGTVTQGFAIENTFNRLLPAELRPHGDSEAHRTAFQEAVRRDEARANREFYTAAVGTYHWMYNRMIPALQRGLQTEELAYYRGVAAIRHRRSSESDELQDPFDMRAEDLMPVWRAAKTNNDRVMSAAGWPTP